MKAQVARLFVLYLAAVVGAVAMVLLGIVTIATVDFLDKEWAPDRSIGDFIAEGLSRAPWAERPDQPSRSPAEALMESLPIWTLTVVAPLAWYMLIWHFFGRDPKAGAIFPRFRPPRGLSPATVRQIAGMGFDQKVMAAEILNLAVRGHIRVIRTERGLYCLQRIPGGGGLLTAGQRHLIKALFIGGPEIVIGPEHGAQLRVQWRRFRKIWKKSLKDRFTLRISG